MHQFANHSDSLTKISLDLHYGFMQQNAEFIVDRIIHTIDIFLILNLNDRTRDNAVYILTYFCHVKGSVQHCVKSEIDVSRKTQAKDKSLKLKLA